MKTICPICKRNVGTKRSGKTIVTNKHRTGRSKPKKVKPICKGTGQIVKV